MQRARDAGCDLIGVNTRDLRTFKVDLETALALASKFSSGVVRVAESGIHSADDIAQLRAAGYDAFLVGESLMRAESAGRGTAGVDESTESRVPSTEWAMTMFREFLFGPVVVPASTGSFDCGFASLIAKQNPRSG